MLSANVADFYVSDSIFYIRSYQRSKKLVFSYILTMLSQNGFFRKSFQNIKLFYFNCHL